MPKAVHSHVWDAEHGVEAEYLERILQKKRWNDTLPRLKVLTSYVIDHVSRLAFHVQ